VADEHARSCDGDGAVCVSPLRVRQCRQCVVECSMKESVCGACSRPKVLAREFEAKLGRACRCTARRSLRGGSAAAHRGQ
jgi:hypothetical protein